ncbi:uncharacterized protein LOC142344448 isoform X2 [Convolutriloba macropyga]
MLRKSGMTKVSRVDSKHILQEIGFNPDKTTDVEWRDLQTKIIYWTRPYSPPMPSDQDLLMRLGDEDEGEISNGAPGPKGDIENFLSGSRNINGNVENLQNRSNNENRSRMGKLFRVLFRSASQPAVNIKHPQPEIKTTLPPVNSSSKLRKVSNLYSTIEEKQPQVTRSFSQMDNREQFCSQFEGKRRTQPKGNKKQQRTAKQPNKRGRNATDSRPSSINKKTTNSSNNSEVKKRHNSNSRNRNQNRASRTKNDKRIS